jgi:hypothetical protein
MIRDRDNTCNLLEKIPEKGKFKFVSVDSLPSISYPISENLVKIDLEIDKEMAMIGRLKKEGLPKNKVPFKDSPDERSPSEDIDKHKRGTEEKKKKEVEPFPMKRGFEVPEKKKVYASSTEKYSSGDDIITVETKESGVKKEAKPTVIEDQTRLGSEEIKKKISKIQFEPQLNPTKNVEKPSLKAPERKNSVEHLSNDFKGSTKPGKIENKWLSPPNQQKFGKKPGENLEIEVISDRTKRFQPDAEESLDTGFFEITPDPTPEGKQKYPSIQKVY